MTYTLVGAPALGFDLVRRPAGDRVAVVLRTALACTPRDLVRLAGVHVPGGCRPRGVRGPDRVVDSLGAASQALELAESGRGSESAAALRRLELATLGDLTGLGRFLRAEVLDWAAREDSGVDPLVLAAAADVLDDAAAASFADDLGAGERRAMGAPFVGSRVSRRDERVETGVPAVDRLLARVTTSTHQDREAWRSATDRARAATGRWAPAFHEASWAAHLTERTRVAADVQLAGVLAFRAGGFDPRDAAYGVWNALSGTLQALVTSDVLGADEFATLTLVHDLVSP